MDINRLWKPTLSGPDRSAKTGAKNIVEFNLKLIHAIMFGKVN